MTGNVKILGVADLERNAEFLPDVPTFKELGYDVDDSSVNFRGIMVPKGTAPEVIEMLAERVPEMFKNKPRRQADEDRRFAASGHAPRQGRRDVEASGKPSCPSF